MKKIVTAFFGICILLALQNCNRHLGIASYGQKDTVTAVFTELPESENKHMYLPKQLLAAQGWKYYY